MARLAKLALFGNVAKSATVNLDATVGAQIGTNLLLPDGTIGTIDQLRKLFGSTGSTINTTVQGNQLDSTDDLTEGRFNLYARGEVIEEPGTARTASFNDTRRVVHGTNTGGLAITIASVATAGWLVGTELYALQGAAGTVQFIGATGVTFATSDSQQTRALGSLIGVKMIAADVWEAVGDLAYTYPALTVQANPIGSAAQPITLAATADKQVLKRKAGTLQWVQQVAADVVVTPVGGIASTDTQSALAELDTKKVAYTALAASTPTAGAALVGVKPSGGIASTSLDAALAELDAKKIAKSLLTAMGDLIVGGASGVPARLASGSLGQVPMVQADGSLAYGTVSTSGGMLPLTTGEVPPVLVYLNNGSLVYVKVT